ncbi:hypothetical protein ACF1D3_18035 [Streptomyces sp. NPDC014728]|uniref:hypothetical protein n=1 Tax=Streptomyces sp. NPDC014728 TaxID=3364884 RepID=UPI0036F61A1F
MASIVERPKKDGTTAYQVKWHQDGEWQSEKFGDSDSAKQFKNLVEAHGGQWPHLSDVGDEYTPFPVLDGEPEDHGFVRFTATMLAESELNEEHAHAASAASPSAVTGKVCPEGAASGACDRKAAESPRMGSPLLERSRELGEGLRGLSANAEGGPPWPLRQCRCFCGVRAVEAVC